jgi:hypothetical protein
VTRAGGATGALRIPAALVPVAPVLPAGAAAHGRSASIARDSGLRLVSPLPATPTRFRCGLALVCGAAAAALSLVADPEAPSGAAPR